MYTELRKIEFYLPGCNSLKEKRSRLRGIKDKFGKNSNLALVESAFQDQHSRAIWSFVSIGQTKSIVDSVLNSVENPMKKNMFFSALSDSKFRHPIIPGDQLRLEMSVDKFRLGTALLIGKGYVGDKLVAEGKLKATVVDRAGA